MGVSSSSTNISIQLMIKYEYKKETLIESTIENRLNDLGGKGWELVLLMQYHLEPALTLYLQDILKDQRFLNQTQLG
jgi:hypothetical protein